MTELRGIGSGILWPVAGRVIKSVRVERALNTIGRMEKPPSRKGGEYRRSDVHASDPGDACGRRRGEEAYAPVAQWNRAPPSGGGRRRFKSGRGHVGTHDGPWKTEECWSIPAAVAHARRR